MEQTSFLAMCHRGHVREFPWLEWVHRSATPSCQGPLKLLAGGGSTLLNTWVVCECGAKRSLGGITQASASGPSTRLSNTLRASGDPFLCEGERPWLADHEPSGCGHPLLGARHEASNFYFARTQSAIFLPRADSSMLAKLEMPPLAGRLRRLSKDSGGRGNVSAELFRLVVEPYLTGEDATAIALAFQSWKTGGGPEPDVSKGFRQTEFEALQREQQAEGLIVRRRSMESYSAAMQDVFSQVNDIPQLRETRALVGFSRIYADTPSTLEEQRRQLFRHPPRRASWLPAQVVHGEGLFLALDEERLQKWEATQEVQDRAALLQVAYEAAHRRRGLAAKSVTPRLILLHTLAHLVINRLTFDCGYSSASLRERLYVGEEGDSDMAGILIFTAAGDADGTMGGLVRMGQPDRLEPLIRSALRAATWCSGDPVCMEAAQYGGQGPDSCNLAACHNCALLPETSCEEFNRFLDRAMVTGTEADRELGFLSGLLTSP